MIIILITYGYEVQPNGTVNIINANADMIYVWCHEINGNSIDSVPLTTK